MSDAPKITQTRKQVRDFKAGDVTKSHGRNAKVLSIRKADEKVWMDMKLMEKPFSKVTLDGVHESFEMPIVENAGEENVRQPTENNGNSTTEPTGSDSTESDSSNPDPGEEENQGSETPSAETETPETGEKNDPPESEVKSTGLNKTLGAALKNKK